jgi:hypothetical protein
MPRLKKLYLNGNALREIPESIAACATAHFCDSALSTQGAFTRHGRAQVCKAGVSGGETEPAGDAA